jgi:uncharacterized 2Fe-2S/4Fe-4S cluster protein (DUF4445 family)
MTTAGKVTIEFQPHEKMTRVPPGMTLFNAANWIGLAIDSTCGARGTCGKCKVRILQGSNGVTAADSKVFSEAELAQGWRLSCRAVAYEDVVCEVPRLMGNPKAALMGFEQHVILDPNVHKVFLQLAEPSLEDQRTDFQRIKEALAVKGFDVVVKMPALRTIPRTIRQAHWQITAVVVGQELIAIEAGDTSNAMYGLAFDIGTTTVVGMLLNLKNGVPQAVNSTLNGQASYGADVISRISHGMMVEGGAEQLQQAILGSINGLIAKLLAESGIVQEQVYEATIAGNATMLHILLGMDPEAIGVTPFIPVIEDGLNVPAKDAGIHIHPSGNIYTLPHLGAYVGADLVGGLLATGLVRGEGYRLLVDVGTNGEIICGCNKRTVATAAPAGPAFEGASIQDGMRASAGAIEAVKINGDEIELQVIGDVKPIGLCGSGLLDAVAQLYLSGLMVSSGRFLKANKVKEKFGPNLAKRIIVDEQGMRSFVLAWAEESGSGKPIVLTQRDIRELQFAKGSIAAGIEVVMNELGIGVNDLVDIYLAGSFGNYINPQSARVIGLVPPLPVERIKAVGNTAGEGAKIALLSFRERQVGESLPHIVEYHELSGRADFNDSFIDVLAFPDLESLGIVGEDG